MTGAVSPAGDKHPPGQIMYDDRVEHRTWTENAADVPPTMAWVKVHDQWKPVVRIEINGAGDTREMTSFGHQPRVPRDHDRAAVGAAAEPADGADAGADPCAHAEEVEEGT